MILRDYQVDAISHLLGTEAARLRLGAVGLPQGSGKSLVLVVAAARGLAEGRFRKVVVLVPQTHIENGFARDVHVSTPWGDTRVLRESWAIPRNSQAAKEEDCDYLQRFYQGPQPWMVTTYAKFCRMIQSWPEGGFSETVLLLDECHHAGTDDELDSAQSTQIHQSVTYAHQRGAHLWAVSATLFRSDRLAIFPVGVAPFVVSYAQIAAAGVLPYTVEMRSAALPPQSYAAGQITAIGLDAIVGIVMQEGRPTSIRLPPSRVGHAGESRRAAHQLQAAFARRGLAPKRVLVLVGERGQEDVEEGLTRLAAEWKILQERGYPGRTFDVVISVGRMREATDWPICSMDLAVGAPTSPLTYVQGVGRATRPKRGITGYPAAWVDRTIGIIATPQEDLKPDALQRVLLACLVLEGSSAAGSYSRFWLRTVQHLARSAPGAVRFGRTYTERILGVNPQAQESALALTYSASAALLQVEDHDPTLSEVGRAVLARFVHQATLDGGTRELLRIAAVGDVNAVVQSVVEAGGDVDQPALIEAFAHTLAIAGSASPRAEAMGERIAAHLRSAAEAADQGHPEPIDPLLKALLLTAEEFGDLVVPIRQKIADLETKGFCATLTPGKVREVMLSLERKRDAAYCLTVADGMAFLRSYWKVHKAMPKLGATAQEVGQYLPHDLACVLVPCSLRDVDEALRRASQAMGQVALGVPELCACLVLGYYDGQDQRGRDLLPPQLTASTIRAALLRWPYRKSYHGATADLLRGLEQVSTGRVTPDQDLKRFFNRPETAVGLELACRFGWRGLPANTTLAEVIR